MTYFAAIHNEQITRSVPGLLITRPHLFPIGLIGQGDINDPLDTNLLASQYAAGVRMRVLEPKWGTVQTSALGTLDPTTMNAYQARVDAFVATGTDTLLTLDMGLHYCGAWVEAQNPITDQYNVQWQNVRGASSAVPNIMWSPTVRTWAADYIHKMITGINWHGRLWAIRNGVNGAEWALPPRQVAGTVGTTTALSGTGTVMTYTVANSLVTGNLVTITGAVPASYNGTNLTVASATGTSFTVAGTATGSQTSAGTVTVANPSSLWSYDSTAQTQAALAVVGGNLSGVAPPRWSKSGLATLANTTQASNYYAWYVDSITSAANWVHDQIRQWTNAWICPLTPGGGLWSHHINTLGNALLDNNVPGYGPISAGNWWERMYGSVSPFLLDNVWQTSAPSPTIPSFKTGMQGCMNWNSGLNDTSGAAYHDPVTGSIDSDSSPDPGDWTSGKIHAWLASQNNRLVYGENPGQLADASQSGMAATFAMAMKNGYAGLMWVRQSQMGSGGFASLSDLAAQIALNASY